jgi:hypothetical protein
VANIVSLTEVRTWLRFPNPDNPSGDDTVLQWLINAADLVVTAECDDVLPTLYNEFYDGGNFTIHLWHAPVLEVLNVEESWGWINWELDYQQVNASPSTTGMFGYSIDSHVNAQISRRSVASVQIPFRPGTGNIHVVYKAGESSIPGNVFLAELKLIGHWYQNSQLRAVALAGTNVGYDAVLGQAYTRDTESGNQNINIGVPFAILEELKSHRRRPIIA